MRRLLLVALLLVGMAASGCATIFCGRSQDVEIETNVPGSKGVVLGGTLGSILSTAADWSYVAQKIFDILDPLLGDENREALRKLDINELITYAAVRTSDMEMPKEIVMGKEFLEKLPGNIIQKVMDLFSIMYTGAYPTEINLRRAKTYAVIAWAPGHKARVETIGIRFNWVTLWNILNFGLGFFVDALTGAWSNLETPIEFELPVHNG